MILNSGRHTQPDPQSCHVRSLGGRRREPKKINNASRDQNKTEQCDAQVTKPLPTQTQKKTSQRNHHLTQRQVAKACDNNTQTIPNNMVLWQDWQHAGGARDLSVAILAQAFAAPLVLARTAISYSVSITGIGSNHILTTFFQLGRPC